MMAPSPDLRRIGWSTSVLYYPDSGRVRLSQSDSLDVYTAIQSELKEGAEVLVARFHVHAPAGARETSPAFVLSAPGMGGRTFAIPYEEQPPGAAAAGSMEGRRYYALLVTDLLAGQGSGMEHVCLAGDNLDAPLQGGGFKPASTATFQCRFVHTGPREGLRAAFEQHVEAVVTPALRRLTNAFMERERAAG